MGTGTYSYITIVGAPSTAKWGEYFTVRVRIFDEYGISFYATTHLELDGHQRDGDVGTVPKGGYHEWGPFGFTMQNRDVTLTAQSWCFIDSAWIMDAEDVKEISLETEPPPPDYDGTIIRTQLEYNSTVADIPVTDIPIDTSARLRVTCRNEMSTAQSMGFQVLIFAPYSGAPPPPTHNYEQWKSSVASMTTWTYATTSFSLNKTGTWVTRVRLFMNSSDPVMVDELSYVDLCTVTSDGGEVVWILADSTPVLVVESRIEVVEWILADSTPVLTVESRSEIVEWILADSTPILIVESKVTPPPDGNGNGEPPPPDEEEGFPWWGWAVIAVAAVTAFMPEGKKKGGGKKK